MSEKLTDYFIVLLNMETQETMATLCKAGSSAKAAEFMTEKYADRGLVAVASFDRADIVKLVALGVAVIARPPLAVEEYTKLRQFILNDPVFSSHAKAFGGGTDEGLHDRLPDFVEAYRENIQEAFAKRGNP